MAVVLRETKPLQHRRLLGCVLIEEQNGLKTQRALEDRQLSPGIATHNVLQRVHGCLPGVQKRAAFDEVLPQSG